MSKNSQSPSSRNRRKKPDQIDVAAIFKKLVEVRLGGRKQKMSAEEASLHALVKKALQEGSLNANNTLLSIASKHDLLKAKSVPKNSGVRISPMSLTEEQFERYEKAKADGLLTPDDQKKVFMIAKRRKTNA